MQDGERDRIFGEWLAGHKGILFKVVHAYAFEHADRQDLFQEVAVQVWRSVDAFRGDSSVPTWMYRVALNTAINWSRKETRHQRGKEPFEGMEDLLTTASAEKRDPRVEWLYQQIAQLKDVDRSVALLLLDGFSYKEIAAITGLTESNVGVKINRIKATLAGKHMRGNQIMNLDELMAVWKSQDAAPLHDVNKTLLHQALQRDEAELQKVRRIAKRIIYVVSAFLFLTAALFLAIMIDPNQPTTFSSRFIGWDYVVGGIGVAAAVTMAGAWFVARRSWLVREQGFGDSLRDQLRRRIAQIDAEATSELRLGLITVAATFICAKAINIVAGRIKHVPVPWSEIGEIDWPSPFWTILILGFFCLWFFRWMPRERRRNLSRKRQLEALLKELDGQ